MNKTGFLHFAFICKLDAFDLKLKIFYPSAVKLGNKERFDKEQIGIKEPFPVTNLPFTS